MAIRAIIPPGQAEITVNGLHQWDYGQKLEIQSEDLPALVEVHFACVGMTEAVVRSCATVDGVATAAIPDRCLEQTSPVTAWVYLVDTYSGTTGMTITLPIIPRTRPQPRGVTVPEEFSDVYTEAIAEVNELVEDIKETVDDLAAGNLPIRSVAYAYEADLANHATTAGRATEAAEANYAIKAGEAIRDAKGRTIDTYYAPQDRVPFRKDISCNAAWTNPLYPWVTIGQLEAPLRNLRSIQLVARTSAATGSGRICFTAGMVYDYSMSFTGEETVYIMCTGGGSTQYTADNGQTISLKMLAWVDLQLKRGADNGLTVTMKDGFFRTASGNHVAAFNGSTLEKVSLYFEPEVTS